MAFGETSEVAAIARDEIPRPMRVPITVTGILFSTFGMTGEMPFERFSCNRIDFSFGFLDENNENAFDLDLLSKPICVIF